MKNYQKLYDLVKGRFHESNQVIMHPNTWDTIVVELGAEFSIEIEKTKTSYTRYFIFGLAVYRSTDIEEGEFILF